MLKSLIVGGGLWHYQHRKEKEKEGYPI
jgi:hypothetical protein